MELKGNFTSDIFIKSDLQLSNACAEIILFDAKTEGMQQFVGNYTLSNKKEIRSVELKDVFIANSYLPKMDENLMNVEIGSWKYKESTGELFVYFNKRSNPNLGILCIQPSSYTFTVQEKEGKLSFFSEQFLLEKRN